MKMRRLNLIAVIVLVSFAGAADAAVVNLTPSPAGPTLSPGDLGLIPTTAVPASFSTFTQDWFFSVASASGLGGAVSSIDLTAGPGLNTAITGLSAKLIDLTTSMTVASGSASFLLPSVASGNYELVVSGIPTGSLGGAYAGEVALTAVPLPAAAFLLLSGLVCVVALGRRRKSEQLT